MVETVEDEKEDGEDEVIENTSREAAVESVGDVGVHAEEHSQEDLDSNVDVGKSRVLKYGKYSDDEAGVREWLARHTLSDIGDTLVAAGVDSMADLLDIKKHHKDDLAEEGLKKMKFNRLLKAVNVFNEETNDVADDETNEGGNEETNKVGDVAGSCGDDDKEWEAMEREVAARVGQATDDDTKIDDNTATGEGMEGKREDGVAGKVGEEGEEDEEDPIGADIARSFRTMPGQQLGGSSGSDDGSGIATLDIPPPRAIQRRRNSRDLGGAIFKTPLLGAGGRGAGGDGGEEGGGVEEGETRASSYRDPRPSPASSIPDDLMRRVVRASSEGGGGEGLRGRVRVREASFARRAIHSQRSRRSISNLLSVNKGDGDAGDEGDEGDAEKGKTENTPSFEAPISLFSSPSAAQQAAEERVQASIRRSDQRRLETRKSIQIQAGIVRRLSVEVQASDSRRLKESTQLRKSIEMEAAQLEELQVERKKIMAEVENMASMKTEKVRWNTIAAMFNLGTKAKKSRTKKADDGDGDRFANFVNSVRKTGGAEGEEDAEAEKEGGGEGEDKDVPFMASD